MLFIKVKYQFLSGRKDEKIYYIEELFPIIADTFRLGNTSIIRHYLFTIDTPKNRKSPGYTLKSFV